MKDVRRDLSKRDKLFLFLILFLAYQAPEGIGMRLLQSMSVLSVLMLLFFPVAWLVGRAMGFRGYDAWFLDLRKSALVLLCVCFIAAISAKVAAIFLGMHLGIYQIASNQLSLTFVSLLSAMAMTFFPSVAEDIVTRGFVMRIFPVGSRWLAIVLVSSVVYVLNHIYRLANGPVEWLMLFCFGLAYASVMVASKSLWPAVGLHWGWNFAGAMSDQVADITLLDRQSQSFLSAGVHLVLFAICLVWIRQRNARQSISN